LAVIKPLRFSRESIGWRDILPARSRLHGEGDTRFAVQMDLVMIGDFTSLHLAELNDIDPSAVSFISDTVKEGLTSPKLRKQIGP
jgi:hypothetical protein